MVSTWLCVCLSLLLVLLQPSLETAVNTSCTVDDIQVKSNFNLTRYLGRWYEIRWLAPSYIPASDLFQDYYHNYVATATSNVTGLVSGRYPNNPTSCFSQSIVLTMTSQPGKMRMVTSSYAAPYWVVDTDYTGFALVYGCYNVSSDNTCNAARLWFWSRTPSMTSERLASLKSTASNTLCLNLTFLLTTSHTNSCDNDDDDDVDSAGFTAANLLVVALTSLLAKYLAP